MKITRIQETATTVLENECIVLNLDNGQYFGLEGALKELWLEIQNERKDTKDILIKWKTEFDQTEEELSIILIEAIQELTQNQLIKIEDKS
ncbi:PqqD family peptide modification chaperone [Bacillus swezeyi]|uniref:PqqD family protein n=1 Tax=Bacillus swezeyi TaxID=1925020 RepID=A0A1R1S1G4_9BACI|nr:PqqD family peptide modification chaperone [Bacillus swezeyi]MEC1259170.1 PqqD family peptide modification chaperone [Bacillus swezeyi]MED1740495.1 PqqD family peptide modification chaperone [Bacillus swezeyi]MED2927869.1 PqqD family peptide modification chaperone [Bacillus swezeyi]MED2942130.1 PqqD family peptide modification chaperone [Bacillus swezeyi]MED2965219.1 PqqD family peptide modification chaperone [Bacillus swezeyi]